MYLWNSAKVIKLSCRKGKNIRRQAAAVPVSDIRDIRQEHWWRLPLGLDILMVYFPQIPPLHCLVVSHGQASLVKSYMWPKYTQACDFKNPSSTNQKGNLHCDPINPLPPGFFCVSGFFIQVLVSSHIMEFLLARFCCYAHGRDVFLLSYCRVCSCSEGRKAPCWNAREGKRYIFEMKALSSWTAEWHRLTA